MTRFDELMRQMKVAGNEPIEECKCRKLLNSLPEKYESIVTAIEVLAGKQKFVISRCKSSVDGF